MTERVAIAFGVDEAYAPHAGVVLASIARWVPAENLLALFVHHGVSAQTQAQVQQCAPGAQCRWVELEADGLAAQGPKGHLSSAALFRLELPRLASDLDRIIYLDADLVALADIRPLWNTDLQGRMVGAVYDPAFDALGFAPTWGLSPRANGYFNSGVLLLDLAEIRRSGAFEDAKAFALKHYEALPYPDQDALNVIYWDRWTALDPLWNLQRRMAMPQEDKPRYPGPDGLVPRGRPRIVHFTESNKPWLKDAYHPLTWGYHAALDRTPFRDQVLRQSGITPWQRARWRVKYALRMAGLL